MEGFLAIACDFMYLLDMCLSRSVGDHHGTFHLVFSHATQLFNRLDTCPIFDGLHP